MLPLYTGREGPGGFTNSKVKQFIILNDKRKKHWKNAIRDSFYYRDVAGTDAVKWCNSRLFEIGSASTEQNITLAEHLCEGVIAALIPSSERHFFRNQMLKSDNGISVFAAFTGFLVFNGDIAQFHFTHCLRPPFPAWHSVSHSSASSFPRRLSSCHSAPEPSECRFLPRSLPV